MKTKIIHIILLVLVLICLLSVDLKAKTVYKNEVGYVQNAETTNNSEGLVSRTRLNTFLIAGGLISIIVVIVLAIRANNNKSISL